ncbi:MAG: transposase family protein [Deltaproteobacteria bacterium]|nr:transposase family protein [Deltaproteobacteria bacterium]
MAKKTGWGYTKLVGAMKPLGHEIGRNTVKRILLNHGIAPAPERKTSWKTFLAAHLDAMAAADFFTVEVLTLFGLVRFSVLFVMQLKTRTVEIAGITSQPSEAWMMQVARNLTDAVDGFLLDMRYLILDRDPLYTAAFRQMLKDSGVEVVRLPARSPNLNAFCERHVLSIKSECLSRIVLLGEAHLRVAIGQYLEHYHGERPHQGLGNRLILQPDKPTAATGPVRCRERLGGILSYYYRDAA